MTILMEHSHNLNPFTVMEKNKKTHKTYLTLKLSFCVLICISHLTYLLTIISAQMSSHYTTLASQDKEYPHKSLGLPCILLPCY